MLHSFQHYFSCPSHRWSITHQKEDTFIFSQHFLLLYPTFYFKNTGCVNISLNTSKAVNYPQLNYLDVSNCSSVDDYTLRKFIKSYGSRLQFFYCRRNDKVSDEGISIMVKYCPQLKEVSLNDCPRITDLTCIELSSKLGTNLKYLSLSKCEHVTDQGLEQMSRFCFKLRYLNVRGCPGISDSGVSAIARSCGPRLRALDVGKCDITDEGKNAIGMLILSSHYITLLLSKDSISQLLDGMASSSSGHCPSFCFLPLSSFMCNPVWWEQREAINKGVEVEWRWKGSKVWKWRDERAKEQVESSIQVLDGNDGRMDGRWINKRRMKFMRGELDEGIESDESGDDMFHSSEIFWFSAGGDTNWMFD